MDPPFEPRDPPDDWHDRTDGDGNVVTKGARHHHKREAEKMEERGFFSGVYANRALENESKKWWDAHILLNEWLYDEEHPSYEPLEYSWPSPYRLAETPRGDEAAAVRGAAAPLGAADPLIGGGNTQARQKNAVRAMRDAADSVTSSPIDPGSFVFVRFERLPGTVATKNAELARFALPWCLAKLGEFDREQSKDQSCTIPIAAWYHSTAYDKKWTEWRIKLDADPGKKKKGKTTPKSVLWGGSADDTIERGSITLSDVAFTKQSGMLNAATKKKLATMQDSGFVLIGDRAPALSS